MVGGFFILLKYNALYKNEILLYRITRFYKKDYKNIFLFQKSVGN